MHRTSCWRVRSQVTCTQQVCTTSAFVSAALAGCIACLTGDVAGTARAEVVLSNYEVAHRFPILNGKYRSTNGTTYHSAPLPIEILRLELFGPTNIVDTIPLPLSPMMDPIFVDTIMDFSASVQIDPVKPSQPGRWPEPKGTIKKRCLIG